MGRGRRRRRTAENGDRSMTSLYIIVIILFRPSYSFPKQSFAVLDASTLPVDASVCNAIIYVIALRTYWIAMHRAQQRLASRGCVQEKYDGDESTQSFRRHSSHTEITIADQTLRGSFHLYWGSVAWRGKPWAPALTHSQLTLT